jgi:hypothetical protein
MLPLVEAIVGAFLASFRSRVSLVAENLALRQQLAVFKRTAPGPRLRPIDRAFCWLCRASGRGGPTCSNREAGHRCHLAWSRICALLGIQVDASRPSAVAQEVVELIERMTRETPAGDVDPNDFVARPVVLRDALAFAMRVVFRLLLIDLLA